MRDGEEYSASAPIRQVRHNRLYSHTAKWFADYQTVNHSEKEYVRDEAYTNTVEGFLVS
jgi:hypothetical protein